MPGNAHGPRSHDRSGQRGHAFPRHVWVTVSDERWPGVLMDWRLDNDTWHALVVWGQSGYAHTGWVPAEQLTPTE